jgi:Zn ribbon nucleic-acid-binding protein
MTYSTQLVATVDGLPKMTWIVTISARCPACGGTATLGESDQLAMVTCEKCGFHAQSRSGNANNVAATLLTETKR